jgi:hypothetical protein
MNDNHKPPKLSVTSSADAPGAVAIGIYPGHVYEAAQNEAMNIAVDIVNRAMAPQWQFILTARDAIVAEIEAERRRGGDPYRDEFLRYISEKHYL